MAYLEFLTLTFKNKFSSFCPSRISGLLKSRANPPFNLSFFFFFEYWLLQDVVDTYGHRRSYDLSGQLVGRAPAKERCFSGNWGTDLQTWQSLFPEQEAWGRMEARGSEDMCCPRDLVTYAQQIPNQDVCIFFFPIKIVFKSTTVVLWMCLNSSDKTLFEITKSKENRAKRCSQAPLSANEKFPILESRSDFLSHQWIYVCPSFFPEKSERHNLLL